MQNSAMVSKSPVPYSFFKGGCTLKSLGEVFVLFWEEILKIKLGGQVWGGARALVVFAFAFTFLASR